jgi:hypothetical protein
MSVFLHENDKNKEKDNQVQELLERIERLENGGK